MNRPHTTFRRLRLVLAAIAALGLLVLPSTASAKRHDRTRDRNHDGIPDKWEKRHHISTKKRGMGKADPDKDGLTNRAEWRSHTNPRLADTNGNGVGDANEDPDGDNVDNGNEAREHTNPCRADTDRDGTKDGKEDADRDHLNNTGEDQSGDDPMNPDTDGDGIKDGDESAGKIVSFDGETLTIKLFNGSEVSGIVDQDTYIDCGGDPSDDPTGDGSGDGSSDPTGDGSGDPTGDDLSDDFGDDLSARRSARFDPGAADPSADDPSVDDPTADDPGADDSTDDPGADDGSGTWDDGSGCTTDALKVGAVVTEASFTATGDGTFFDAIELAQ